MIIIYPMNPIGENSARPLTHPHHVPQRARGSIGLSRRHQQRPQATDLQQIETAARLLLNEGCGLMLVVEYLVLGIRFLEGSAADSYFGNRPCRQVLGDRPHLYAICFGSSTPDLVNTECAQCIPVSRGNRPGPGLPQQNCCVWPMIERKFVELTMHHRLAHASPHKGLEA
jgi:hypothetical protein